MPAARFRRATARDAIYLAVLIDSASRGLVSWLWGTMAERGQSAIELGRSRIANEAASPSHFSNWIVATIDGEIAGALASYPLADPYQAKDATQLPDVYAPMLQLESCAVGSWYVMSLSVFPEFRNRGLGTAMLKQAEGAAREAGFKKLSIMVVSSNESALRLYKRLGFAEIERKAFVPFPGSDDTGDWILLTRAI